jgi:AraC-like DNA-binding protein
MKNFIKFFIVLSTGLVLRYFISKKTSFEKPSYVELPTDYFHDELGVIKKGTQLKFDEGFSEGFSRYILYINISDAENLMLKKSDNINEIIPYWIEKKE